MVAHQCSCYYHFSIKFEIPWERPKSSTPSKNSTKRNLEQSYPKQTKSPNNLVIKKSDLVTRFDVVFEDSTSGAEIKRSHTGHTSRSQGEYPTSIFVSNSVADMNDSFPNRMVSNAAEAALSALKSGRVVAQGDWEGHDSKSVQHRRKSAGKNKTRQVCKWKYNHRIRDRSSRGEGGTLSSFITSHVLPLLTQIHRSSPIPFVSGVSIDSRNEANRTEGFCFAHEVFLHHYCL